MPGVNNDEDEDSVYELGVTIMRSVMISQPCDYAKHFPETAHFQQESDEASGNG